jgi:hypothetical protein
VRLQFSWFREHLLRQFLFGGFSMKSEEPTPVNGREFIIDLVEIVLREES